MVAISEGAGGLASLMDIYSLNMKSFKGQGKMHPVIMLVDDDDGSKTIKQKLTGFDSAIPFTFFKENLYVVHIPLRGDDKETAIEDLFDRKTLETKVAGKTFNRKARKGELDSKKEYGKIVFA